MYIALSQRAIVKETISAIMVKTQNYDIAKAIATYPIHMLGNIVQNGCGELTPALLAGLCMEMDNNLEIDNLPFETWLEYLYLSVEGDSDCEKQRYILRAIVSGEHDDEYYNIMNVIKSREEFLTLLCTAHLKYVDGLQGDEKFRRVLQLSLAISYEFVISKYLLNM